MSKRALCPSAPCREGALLNGIVQSDGSVAFLNPALPVNSEFIQIAKQGREPEKRFRFSAPCAAQRCTNWRSGQCDLIHRICGDLLEQGISVSAESRRNGCDIQEVCVWFKQLGSAACAACRYVITNV